MNAPSKLPVLPFTTAEIAFILFFLMLNMLFLVVNEPCPTCEVCEDPEETIIELRDCRKKTSGIKKAIKDSGLTPEEGFAIIEEILITARRRGIDPRDITGIINEPGTGAPSCWYNLESKEEYLFQIILYDDGVRFDPVWPRHRTADAAKIPGVSEVQTGIIVSPWSQSQALNQILAYSDRKNPAVQDEPPCRYYAWFVDETTTKQPYKVQLDYLEGFFYKNFPISKKRHPSMRR
ncbi:MAG: hypothetical protein OXU92_05895 [Deltaproteobacteria bacterium]|nr:hypothetical protein [Deltaproteobacteria bacterium]